MSRQVPGDGALLLLRRPSGVEIVGRRDGDWLRDCVIMPQLVPVDDLRLIRGGRLRADYVGVIDA